jgi:GH15 family glucan-1,4-alpha-glucosidase
LRAAAGDPSKLQIVYGIGGERRLEEAELDWLPGYDDSHPVRIGNAASHQFQLDVYGEVIDAVLQARRAGAKERGDTLDLLRQLGDEVIRRWREPDRGMWEMRGAPRHFTHSKVMAWVALDRMCAMERDFAPEDVARWKAAREAVHDDVCAHGYDPERRTFVQAYGSPALDASSLLMPIVGFLPWDDPRVIGTVAAVERELLQDGLVKRYSTHASSDSDALPPGEGVFLACSFWLADYYCLAGRFDDARILFERLLGLANDVGLLSEEYDPQRKRLVGNFPQAFSHVGLVNTALNLARDRGPAKDRSEAALVRAV